jgi:hypothetical protein
MRSLFGRVVALDAARLVAVSGGLFMLLLVAAWVYSAITGRLDLAALAAVVVAALIALIGLL